MLETGQLNIHSYANRHARSVQTVQLYHHEELTAEMVVLPPGRRMEATGHPACHEVFDVVDGSGQFQVDGRTFAGTPGKCVFVAAGVDRMLYNDGDTPWVLRVTTLERVGLRDVGRLLVRTVRCRLGLP